MNNLILSVSEESKKTMVVAGALRPYSLILRALSVTFAPKGRMVVSTPRNLPRFFSPSELSQTF
jgi:hypothetical protein